MTAPSLLDELEPCPFCGTPDVEVYPTDRARSRWNVCCGNPGCVARGDNDYLTEADAIVAWNRRTHHAEIADMAKRLEAAERDAARWRHARKLLTVDDIEGAQGSYDSFGRLVSEDECKRADDAIDAAAQEGEG